MIYIIAGEHSGDFIGSRIMSNMKDQKFYGIGGELMQQNHLNLLFDINQINLMGFAEVLPSLLRIIKLQKLVVQDILAKKPSLLITIDSPGFTYPIAKRIKKLAPNIHLVHIVAPSVWAYRPKRAIKYAKVYHHLLALLPFEPQFFIKHGLPTTFIGYIGLEQFTDTYVRRDWTVNTKEESGVTQICVTCGSRMNEISTLAPVFIQSINILVNNGTSIHAVFVIVKPADQRHILDILRLHPPHFSYSFCHMHEKTVQKSAIALCKSGTNTMQIACKAIPMVICYKPNLLSYWLLKYMVKVKFACLINILANQEIWQEFVGPRCTAKNIAVALKATLSDANIQSKIHKTQEILQSIGYNRSPSPSQLASQCIYHILRFKEN